VTIDGVWIGYINHLQVVTTNNYNTLADFHTIKSPHAKPSPASSVFTRRSLSTASNVEICHLYALKSSLHRLPYRIDLVAPIVFLITPRPGPSRKPRFQSLLLRVDSLLSNVQERLPRNGPRIFAYLAVVA
jgi:hypothetical protein